MVNNGNGCTASTPSGYTALGDVGNSKYFISNNVMTFAVAQAESASLGGHLTSISSQAENEFIRSNLDGNIVLIGLNDLANEGNLVWDNGESVNYNNLTTSNNNADDVAVINFWNGE